MIYNWVCETNFAKEYRVFRLNFTFFDILRGQSKADWSPAGITFLCSIGKAGSVYFLRKYSISFCAKKSCMLNDGLSPSGIFCISHRNSAVTAYL